MSLAFWTRHQVATIPVGMTAAESLALMDWRNSLYPGLLDLMPLAYPDKRVLDFGCGPGHDTIGMLLGGAAHVYAADFSPTAIDSVRRRVAAHGFEDRCTPILIPPDEDWQPPTVDHIHAAGVIHHCADPVAVLRRLRGALTSGGDLSMMVYSAESHFYIVQCGGDPDTFRARADADAPIANAWTRDEVIALVREAGFDATFLGSYTNSEPEGWPSYLASCWVLR